MHGAFAVNPFALLPSRVASCRWMGGRYALRTRSRRQLGNARSLFPSRPTLHAGSPGHSSSSDDADALSRDDDFVASKLEADARSDSSWENASFGDVEEQDVASPKRKRKRQKMSDAIPVKSEMACNGLPETFQPSEVRSFRLALLSWYIANCRSLPWRAKPRFRVDGPCIKPEHPATESSPGAPYAVWVSEVMSQQTRLSVCVEYWKRWMEAFPTVEALAEAPMDRVNELWAGLGYYRRAKFLHEGAKQVIDEFGGTLPSSFDKLLTVRGIGRYTAGAICSVAFNARTPAVDGNVERVLSRVRPGILPNKNPAASPGSKSKVFENLAKDLLCDIECAGDFNQALMELGALTCTPKSPKCSSCPVQSLCGSFAGAIQSGKDASSFAEQFPVKNVSKKTKVRDETVLACVICRQRCGHGDHKTLEYLLVQRPDKGLLAGMWEVPSVVVKPKSSDSPLQWELDSFVGTLFPKVQRNAVVSDILEIGETRHVFSHIRQHLRVHFVQVADNVNVANDLETSWRWLDETEIKDSAIATQMRKVLAIAFTRCVREK